MTTHRPPAVLVREWMSPEPLVVQARDGVERARILCEEHRINQLPVMSGKTLVGIVTDRDLRDVYPSAAEEARSPTRAHGDMAGIRVADVMTSRVLTADADDGIGEAATRMQEERIGALPVVSGGRLVGIITRHDLLRALVALIKHVPRE